MSTEKFYTGEDVSALVFELGSNSIRAGYGGLYETPQFEIPTITGITDCYKNNNLKKCYSFGDVSLSALPSDAECRRFIENITDYNAFAEFIDWFLSNQTTETLDVPLFFIEHPEFDRKGREQLSEIMFESLNVPAISIFPSSPLVMLYKDKPIGTVIDFGSWHTTASCVHNMYLMRSSVKTSLLGGDYIANKAHELCKAKNLTLPMTLFNNDQYNYFLKHRGFSELGAQLFKVFKDDGTDKTKDTEVAEAFFDSRYLNEPIDGYMNMTDLVSSSIKSTDPDIQYQLWKTFVTTGGLSQMPGMVTRLKNMTFGRYSPYINGNTILVKDPSWDAWKGGSIVVGTGSFQQQWYSIDQYSEGDQKMLFHY